MLETAYAFGSETEYTFAKGNLKSLNSERALVLSGVCQIYIENKQQATIRIKSLRQPNYEKPTDSFKIHITTALDESIAMADTGLQFTPQRGEIQTKSDAEMKVV